MGHDITLVTSGFEGGPREEVIDGVRIIRVGNRWSVYRKAKEFYLDSKEHYDIVIDEINTHPFMTPNYVNRGESLFAFIHQLAREFWFYETPFPVSYVGRYYLEDRWLKKYVDVPTITVSKSTENDLRALGFKHTMIVPEGNDFPPLDKVGVKESKPTLVYVARFKKAKFPDHALAAFELVKEEIPDAQLWMIGDGYMKPKLEKKGVSGAKFFGRLDRQTKNELVSRSHILMAPALREGWGLVVTEANSLGTPAVGYDVPGLRDSITDGLNGLLTRPDPKDMAKTLLKLLSDKNELQKMSERALEDSRKYDWDRSAEIAANYLGLK